MWVLSGESTYLGGLSFHTCGLTGQKRGGRVFSSRAVNHFQLLSIPTGNGGGRVRWRHDSGLVGHARLGFVWVLPAQASGKDCPGAIRLEGRIEWRMDVGSVLHLGYEGGTRGGLCHGCYCRDCRVGVGGGGRGGAKLRLSW